MAQALLERPNFTPASNQPIELSASAAKDTVLWNRQVRRETGVANAKAWMCCLGLAAICLFELHEIVVAARDRRIHFRIIEQFELRGILPLILAGWLAWIWVQTTMRFRNESNKLENEAPDFESTALIDQLATPLLDQSVLLLAGCVAGVCQMMFLAVSYFI